MSLPDTKDLLVSFHLNDGMEILLRPVVPEDINRMREGLKLLSEQSVHTRFNSGLGQISELTLRQLIKADQENHIAWGALAPSRPDLPGLGIVHMIKLQDRPGVAEVAVTVIDAYHNRGLGTTLIALMYLLAPRYQIHTLTAVMVPANQRYAQLLSRMGAATRFADQQYELNWPVLSDWSVMPDTPEAQTFRSLLEKLSEALQQAETNRSPLE